MDSARDVLESFAEEEGMNLSALRDACRLYSEAFPKDRIYADFIKTSISMFQNFLTTKQLARVIGVPPNRIVKILADGK